MRLRFTPLVVLGALVFFGGLSARAEPNQQRTRPDDFRVVYTWREGSLPPPYHYEYGISFEPSGAGEVVYIPGYPGGTDVPRWVEHFKVEARTLDELYLTMVKKGLLGTKWRQADVQPIGGSSQTLVVTAQGEQIRIADYLIAEQKAEAETMYRAVYDTVPKEIWERFKTKQAEYTRDLHHR